MHSRTFADCALCLSLMMVLGCDGAKYAPVSGTVTLQGKPLAGAFIVFEPVVGSPDQVSNGETDEVGHFVLSDASGRAGCLVGEHHVRITTVPPGAKLGLPSWECNRQRLSTLVKTT